MIQLALYVSVKPVRQQQENLQCQFDNLTVRKKEPHYAVLSILITVRFTLFLTISAISVHRNESQHVSPIVAYRRMIWRNSALLCRPTNVSN